MARLFVVSSALVAAVALAPSSGCSSSGSSSGSDSGNGGNGGSSGDAGEGGDATPGGGTDGGQPSGGQGDGGQGNAGSAGDGSAGAPEPLPECAAGRITALGADVATASTLNGENRFSARCAQGVAPDVAFEWVVPATDFYSLGTAGSDFDTVLSLHLACEGSEIACNDNTATDSSSRLVDEFEEGDRVIVVVDGNAGEEGDARLSIERVTCPQTDLRGQPFPLAVTTVGGTNAHAGECGGAGRREKTYRFIAPEAGLYRFSVSSEVFDPALHVEAGAACGGELLQCNAGRASDWPTRVTRRLTAGQPVTLIVDSTSGEGSFELDVEDLGTQTCPSHELPDDIRTIALADGDVLSGSCQAAGNRGGIGNAAGLEEHRMPLSIQLSDIASCTYTIEADAPFATYLIRGEACDGPEARCVLATGSNMTWTASHRFSAADNGDYVLVVEPATSGFGLSYSVFVACIA